MAWHSYSWHNRCNREQCIGVVGVNWKSKIMALKFLNSGGSGYLSDAVKAIQYAADNEARVSSNSWEVRNQVRCWMMPYNTHTTGVW